MYLFSLSKKINKLVTLATSNDKTFQEEMRTLVTTGQLDAPDVVVKCIASKEASAQEAIKDFFYHCRNRRNPYDRKQQERLDQFPIDAMIACAKSENKVAQNWAEKTINEYGAKGASEIIQLKLAFQILLTYVAGWGKESAFAQEIILNNANSDDPKLKDFAIDTILQLIDPKKLWEEKRKQHPERYEQSEKKWQSTALSILLDLIQKKNVEIVKNVMERCIQERNPYGEIRHGVKFNFFKLFMFLSLHQNEEIYREIKLSDLEPSFIEEINRYVSPHELKKEDINELESILYQAICLQPQDSKIQSIFLKYIITSNPDFPSFQATHQVLLLCEDGKDYNIQSYSRDIMQHCIASKNPDHKNLARAVLCTHLSNKQQNITNIYISDCLFCIEHSSLFGNPLFDREETKKARMDFLKDLVLFCLSGKDNALQEWAEEKILEWKQKSFLTDLIRNIENTNKKPSPLYTNSPQHKC
ncbi:MAG: hypothetical protein ABIH77_04490 [Pseudomonadota bacterium]